ncbi:MAG: cache domain-containing protein [Lachnospiraceae bacterium]|nr:cache domain-containing protein [Lachnospiraceae bacterium]
MKKKKGLSLVVKLIMLAVIPVLLTGAVVTLVGVNSLTNGMGTTKLEDLGFMAQSVSVAYDALDGGEYYLDGDNLMKGDLNITEQTALLDSFMASSNVEVTFFYGDTRRATTILNASGNRIVGTAATEAVYEAVVGRGELYEANNVPINGEQYYAAYLPLKNGSEVIGMLFCGAPQTEVEAFISSKAAAMITAFVVVLVVCVVFVSISVFSLAKGLKAAERAVTGLSEGNLSVEIDEKSRKRGDELGDMVRGVAELKERLTAVVSRIRTASDDLFKAGNEVNTMAAEINMSTEEISNAVNDIAKGASSQAEEIEVASGRINEMGTVIEHIVESVAVLDETSGNMKRSGDDSLQIVHDLSGSNDRTMDAVDRISRQIYATNESANKISEAVELITDIASQTNLLSLNASIEAARAGDQGRGFAVVADQIRSLAEQSGSSASHITSIINDLLKDSEQTVKVMQEVQAIVNEQRAKLEETKNQFANVATGIEQSRTETNGIKGQTEICDTARVTIVDIISNLSAISEENAASSEETTASMAELSSTIGTLADSAEQLQKISGVLEEEMKFFKL